MSESHRQATIRVLHALPWIASGGVERRRLLLARSLGPRFDQKIYSLSARGPVPEEMRAAGMPVETAGTGTLKSVAAVRKLIATTRAFKPHIIHGAVFEGVQMAVLAGLVCRVPVIISEETSYSVTRGSKGQLLFRGLTMASDACVAISPAVGEYLVEGSGVAPAKVRVIQNAVDPPRSATKREAAALRRSLGIPPDAFVVGTVARLIDDSNKRTSDLIRGAAIAMRQSNAHLLIVGDGSAQPALEALAESLGVADRTHFAGYQRDVGLYYKAMDLFALVSREEGFGLVVIEAMHSGVPTLTTRGGGLRDIALADVTGAFVEVGDPDGIAAEIQRFAADPALVVTMGRAAKRRARQDFAPETYVDGVRNLYDELLAAKGVR